MIYDLIIIGGSAAATTAGIYAARRKLNFKIITKDFGGEVATSGEIGNWPGISEIDGFTLSQQFRDHLRYYDIEPEEGVEVEKITRQADGLFCVLAKTNHQSETAKDRLPNGYDGSPICSYLTKTIIIATGVHPRTLNIQGEKEFRGRGVSYCTVCDGPLFAGKTVAVIGGGNSALESALMLSEMTPKVYIINIMPNFTGDEILAQKLSEKKNVEAIFSADTNEIYGNGTAKGLRYLDKAGQTREIETDGVFIHIGMVPNSQLVSGEVKKNNLGEISTDKNCATNIPGLFAAGDVADTPYKQIVIAAGMGCTALLSAVDYLNKLK